MKDKNFFTRSYALLAAGFFFLLNPTINIVDILPDFFGYIMLFFGLTELALLDGSLESARKRIVYLIAIGGAKLLLTNAVASSDLSSDRMLAAFSFAIVESIYLFWFFREFISGFSYFSSRNGAEGVLEKSENASFVSVIFVIARALLTVVPELFSLAETEMVHEVSKQNFYLSLLESQGYVRVLAALLGLAVGIYWFVTVLGMLKAAKKSSEFILNAQGLYKACYLDFPEKRIYSVLRSGVYIATAGAVMFHGFALDGIRLFPDALAVGLIALAAWRFREILPFKGLKKLFFAVFALLALTEVFRYIYIDKLMIPLKKDDLNIIIAGFFIGVISSSAAMLFMRAFSLGINRMFSLLTGKDIRPSGLAGFFFWLGMTLRAVSIALPSLYEYSAEAEGACFIIFFLLAGKRWFDMLALYKDKKLNN